MIAECGFATDGPEPCNLEPDHVLDCEYIKPTTDTYGSSADPPDSQPPRQI